MENPGLPHSLWSILDKKLWHATSVDALRNITREGQITVSKNPRYPSSLCYSLDSVCLFDFGETAKEFDNQFNNWCGWFGSQQQDRIAVWLEINRANVGCCLLNAGESHSIWRQNLSKKFIPGVEACHRGSLPISAVSKLLLIARDDKSVFSYSKLKSEELQPTLSSFENKLPPEQEESHLTKALNAARSKRLAQHE